MNCVHGENGSSTDELTGPRRRTAKHALGFSSSVFRKKFRAGMTVRNYRDNEVIFSQR